MRVAIVAGSDAGHAFPAFALAERFIAAGDEPTVYTGLRWSAAARRRGIEIAELPELVAVDTDDDADAGQKLSVRAARMARALAPVIAAADHDLVISDVITVAGGWAAELCALPWIELSPHPLYQPSRGLPPIGSGLAVGTGLRGRCRDAVMRALSATSVRAGERQRAAARATLHLPGPGSTPDARFVATLPGLEVYRPDWPVATHLIGPLLWEPTDEVFDRPDGTGPLIVIAPSTAVTGAADMVSSALAALAPEKLGCAVRVVISALDRPDVEAVGLGASLIAGLGRQDEILTHADLAICGAGHGMLAKALAAGVPVVTVPGGGDQWELANRVARTGAGTVVRPVTPESIREAVRTILTDRRYRAAARRVADSAHDVVDPVAVARRVVHRHRSGRWVRKVGSCD